MVDWEEVRSGGTRTTLGVGEIKATLSQQTSSMKGDVRSAGGRTGNRRQTDAVEGEGSVAVAAPVEGEAIPRDGGEAMVCSLGRLSDQKINNPQRM